MKTYTPQEIFNNRMSWCAAMRDPRNLKGTRRLTRVQGGIEKDCCLGLACKVLKIEKIGIFWEDFFEYGEKKEVHYLPKEGIEALQITKDGSLTPTGQEIAKNFTSSGYPFLVDYNDHAYHDDVNLVRMGALIERLFEEEYLFGVPTFEVNWR